MRYIIILVIFLLIIYLFKNNIKNKYYEWKYPIKNIKIDSPLTIFEESKKDIDKYIIESINNENLNKKLKRIIIRSLEGGKRVRPVIIISIYKKLTNNTVPEYVMNMSLFIELIHSASLILDDIMDKDVERRGKPSLHVLYGETYAILVSIQMITLALTKMFDSLTQLNNLNKVNEKNNDTSISLLIGNIIVNKLNTLNFGQFLDIDMPKNIPNIGNNFKNAVKNSKINIDIIDLIHKKTSSLFEISFIIPWIIANKDKSKEYIEKNMDNIDNVAKLFGLIFQISDDFEDVNRDLRRDGKNSVMNYVINKGKRKAMIDYEGFIINFIDNSNQLDIYTLEIGEIIQYLSKKVDKYYKIY